MMNIYIWNTVIAGLDPNDKGCIFAFDSVGSMCKELYACEGTIYATYFTNSWCTCKLFYEISVLLIIDFNSW